MSSSTSLSSSSSTPGQGDLFPAQSFSARTPLDYSRQDYTRRCLLQCPPWLHRDKITPSVAFTRTPSAALLPCSSSSLSPKNDYLTSEEKLLMKYDVHIWFQRKFSMNLLLLPLHCARLDKKNILLSTLRNYGLWATKKSIFFMVSLIYYLDLISCKMGKM